MPILPVMNMISPMPRTSRMSIARNQPYQQQRRTGRWGGVSLSLGSVRSMTPAESRPRAAEPCDLVALDLGQPGQCAACRVDLVLQIGIGVGPELQKTPVVADGRGGVAARFLELGKSALGRRQLS